MADLPVEALSARAEELARLWAIALILDRPLDRIGEIPLEQIALDGTALCTQVLRALESDAELGRLTGRGARERSAPGRRLAAIAGSRDAVGAVAAAEALRGVLWEELAGRLTREASGRSSAMHLADVCDRLAYVCAAMVEAAVAEIEASAGRAGSAGATGSALPEAARPAEPDTRHAGGHTGAVIVDELAGAAEPAAAPHGRARTEAPPEAPQEIEIRDQRGVEGPAAWVGTIGRQLERFAHERVPFAVLLLEPLELDGRLDDPDPRHAREAERVAREIESLLAEELEACAAEHAAAGAHAQRRGSVTRERPGRYWLLAPGVDRAGAHQLADRLVRVLGMLRAAGGRPLAVAIGTASCPQDGEEAAALAAHADIGLYAARAAARGTAPRSSAAADRPAG